MNTYFDKSLREFVAVFHELKGFGETKQDAINDLNDQIISIQLSLDIRKAIEEVINHENIHH